MNAMTAPPQRAPGVLHLLSPSDAAMDAAEQGGRRAPWSYDCVGATAGTLPPGYHHDTCAGVVGRGDADWAAACAALRRWAQFDLPWVHLRSREVPIRPGEIAVFASWQLGLWSLNVCRIVYVVDTPDHFGFAYGTLTGHAVAGEERFLLRRDADGQITFEIRKFSRLIHPLVRLAGPAARAVQSRFSRDAIAALARAVAA